MTGEGDVVLIHMDGKPAFFARIEKISPDPKPDWWQVKMLVLQVPLMVVTWILREAYINGEEFTMGAIPSVWSRWKRLPTWKKRGGRPPRNRRSPNPRKDRMMTLPAPRAGRWSRSSIASPGSVRSPRPEVDPAVGRLGSRACEAVTPAQAGAHLLEIPDPRSPFKLGTRLAGMTKGR